MNINEHKAIDIADVIHYYRFIFSPINISGPEVSYLWTYDGVPCGDNNIEAYVAVIPPGTFNAGEYEVTSDIGFIWLPPKLNQRSRIFSW